MSTTPEARFAAGMANPLRATVMYPPSRTLFRPFRVASSERDVTSSLCGARGPLALYVHVPFCETKCTYCDYETVSLGSFAHRIDQYVDGLVAELEAVASALPGDVELCGLDLGGGTPGALSALQFERVLRTVESRFRLGASFEVSTETTPTLAAADPAKWRALAEAGIRRVSMGVQTSGDALLAKLNRAPHGSDRIARGMEALRSAGFAMVNVDLMFALPGLSLEAWEATVDRALSLSPDVVTIYDTVFKNRGIATQAPRWNAVPTPADYRAQYDLAFTALTRAGFSSRYGSVNFSRVAGRLGTSRYLEGRILDGHDYVGVGLYASSLVGDSWRFGRRSFDAWTEAALRGELAAEDLYELPREHVMAKYLLLALSYGYLDAARFERRFGEPLAMRFGPALEFLERRQLMRRAADGWELVEGTFGELPGIRCLFVPDDALRQMDAPVLVPVRRPVPAPSPRPADQVP